MDYIAMSLGATGTILGAAGIYFFLQTRDQLKDIRLLLEEEKKNALFESFGILSVKNPKEFAQGIIHLARKLKNVIADQHGIKYVATYSQLLKKLDASHGVDPTLKAQLTSFFEDVNNIEYSQKAHQKITPEMQQKLQKDAAVLIKRFSSTLGVSDLDTEPQEKKPRPEEKFQRKKKKTKRLGSTRRNTELRAAPI